MKLAFTLRKREFAMNNVEFALLAVVVTIFSMFGVQILIERRAARRARDGGADRTTR